MGNRLAISRRAFLPAVSGVLALSCASRGEPNAANTRGATPVDEAPLSGAPSAQARPPALACEPAHRPASFSLDGYEGLACVDEQGTRDGAFIVWFPDGTAAISGAFSEGELEGPWRRAFPNGKTAEAGEYVGGQMHGRWRRFAEGGGLLGDFAMTRGSGTERLWYADGQLAMEQRLRAGLADGETTVFGDGGVVLYQATFVAGALDGVRRFGVDRGLHLEDFWEQGRPIGARRIWRRSTLELDVAFDDAGRRHGAFAAWRDKSHLREQGSYEHGKRHGLWRWYDREHHLEREGKYVDGERVGTWREWIGGRLVFEGRYAAGRPHGTFRAWSKAGVALGKSRLRNGTGLLATFHDNRKVATKQALVRGVRHGIYEERSPSGRVLVRGQYADDEQTGAWVQRDGDGRLVREAMYVEGKLDGVLRRYVRGELASETTYAAGLRHGPYKEWRDGPAGRDAPAVTGEHVADKRHGEWRFRGAAGELVATYSEGVLDGPWRSSSTGGAVTGSYKSGRRAGAWQWTSAAGALEQTIEYDP